MIYVKIQLMNQALKNHQKNLSPKMSPLYIYIVLLIVIAFHCINNYIIISLDETPLVWDPLSNYLKSANLFKILSFQKDFLTNCTKEMYGLRGIYPPLLYLNSCLFYIFLPTNHQIAMFSNISFFFLLIIFSFKLTALLTDKRTALYTAILISLFPGIYRFSRNYDPDFAVTTFTLTTIYFALKSKSFTNTKYSILTGISSGLGLLSKQSFLFIFPPVFLVILAQKKFKPSANLFKMSLISGLIAFPWYLFNLFNGSGVPTWALAQEFSLEKIAGFFIKYVISLYHYNLGEPTFFVFIVCLIIFIFFIKNKNKSEILTWFFVPLLLFSVLLSESAAKYSLPLIPACSLIIALTFYNLKPLKKISSLLFIILISLALKNYLVTSYPSPISYFPAIEEAVDSRDIFTGLISPKLYESDLSSLNNIAEKHKKHPLKILTLFNGIDAEFIRFEVSTKQKLYSNFESNLINNFAKGLTDYQFRNILPAYDLILLKPKGSYFLAHPQKYYSKSFMSMTKKALNDFRKNPVGFKYLKNITLTFGEHKYAYELYVNNSIQS